MEVQVKGYYSYEGHLYRVAKIHKGAGTSKPHFFVSYEPCYDSEYESFVRELEEFKAKFRYEGMGFECRAYFSYEKNSRQEHAQVSAYVEQGRLPVRLGYVRFYHGLTYDPSTANGMKQLQDTVNSKSPIGGPVRLVRVEVLNRAEAFVEEAA